MNRARPGLPSLVRITLGVLLAASLALPEAWASGASSQGGGAGSGDRKERMTKRPRNEAELTGGELIQLETMWIPASEPGGRRQYFGMTVRLYPETGRFADACYKAPWVNEALINYFHQHPLEQASQAALDRDALRRALKALVDTVAGLGVIKTITILDGASEPPTENDADLSLVCG
ncbi:hypothetical protein [Pararhodospirillum oryzae]|nr:hypothetical protein [Pararhodospirillum oryzae]